MREHCREWIYWGLAAVLVIVAVACLWQGLPSYPHREDSVATIKVIEQIAGGNLPWKDPTFRRSPVGHLLMAVPVWLVGPSDYTYRVTNLVFMALTLLIIIKIGQDLGFRTAGFAAAAYLAFSPIEGLIVSYVRFYAVFQFFFIYCCYMINKYLMTEKNKDLIIATCLMFASFFVHKLSMQIFVVAIIMFLLSKKWYLLKNKKYVIACALLLFCFCFVFFKKSLSLSAEDYNEMMLGSSGSVFDFNNHLFFYHEIKTYVPLFWSITLFGFFLCSLNKKYNHILSYGLSFITIFATIELLAPGDGSYYYGHIFPLGILFAMSTIFIAIELIYKYFQYREWKQIIIVVTFPVVTVVALCWLGYENVNMSMAFGQNLKFDDQKLPHMAMKAMLGSEDVILSTDPGLSEYYLNRPVLFLRQKCDNEDLCGSFPGREQDESLIDSREKFLGLTKSIKGSVWLYGNYKYFNSIGQELKSAISRQVRQVVYYDKPGKLFVMKLGAS